MAEEQIPKFFCTQQVPLKKICKTKHISIRILMVYSTNFSNAGIILNKLRHK